VPGTILKGIGVSPGVARGHAFVLVAVHDRAVPRRDLAEAEVAAEIARFETALVLVEAELAQLQRSLTEQIGAG
jgi:phosphoenolpyruvate-protein kinase (PTS system EI component)